MSVGSAAITVTGPQETALDQGWLIVKQASIPVDHEKATESDLASMLAQLFSGRSAYTVIRSCPVRKYVSGGVWMASYTAEIEVHHSEGLTYELEITKDGTLMAASGPLLTHGSRAESFDTDYSQTQQLGWRAAFNSFAGHWEGGVYDEQARQLSSGPDITHRDGFAYIASPVFGTFRAIGLAEYDSWTVRIEHQLGLPWDASLWAVAWWPAGANRDLQQSSMCEIKLPGCVEEAFKECPDDGEGDGEKYWDVKVNPPKKGIINACDGSAEVIDLEQ